MPDFIVALLSYIHTGSISNIGIIILIVLSLIQIAPIKFNPYDKFFSWLRNKLVGDFNERLNSIWVNFYRQHILRFARECRQNVIHTQDEWQYVLTLTSEYEKYCKDNRITNGVVNAETNYIRELYQEHNKARDFA